MAGSVGEGSDANFDEEVIKSQIPVLVDFWAPWCGPCKSIAPLLEEIAGEYQGKLKILKINVDDNPRTPSHFGVRAIPNLILFKAGVEVDRVVGHVPKDQLIKLIQKAL